MSNTEEKMYSPKVVSIFSGCGGLDLGFHLEGYQTIWANDFAEWAVKSFEKNFGNVIHLKDITKINPYTDKTIPECDIVLGGFPCQDFSIIWKQPGLNGTRGGLFRHFAEFVDAKKPKAFVAENVKGLITANKGKAIETIIKDFSTIERIVDVFPPHQQNQIRSQLASVLEAVISQQLLPTIDGKGRVAAFEVMLGTPAIKNLIREDKAHQIPSIMQTSKKLGMQTMDESLFNLYLKHRIDGANAVEYAQDTAAMQQKLY